MHLKGYFIFRSRLLFPERWNDIDFGIIVKVFSIPESRIVMDKDTAIPRAIKRSGTSMKTLAAFVK